MPDKPEIEKLRVFHDLHTQFDVPQAIHNTLESQLSSEDQGLLRRFMSGFKIEDWFEWIFSALPSVQLIHGLDQQQFPKQSKDDYQVPDFLVLAATSTLEHRPLLVEVKYVPKEKCSLKLQESPMALCERYAVRLQIPLLYSVYWERLSAWTLNTPDVFERKSSSRKLPIALAFEMDCGAILGDISHLVSPTLVRVSRFSTQGIRTDSVMHEKYGRLISDVAAIGNRKVEMSTMESAAIDSMLSMTTVDAKDHGNGETELIESPDSNYLLKLSSWITRHLAISQIDPTEQCANGSAHIITDLMAKLDCPLLHLFPSGRSQQLALLESLFIIVDKSS